MKTLSIILLTIALFTESSLTTFPLILLVLLSLAAIYKENFVFLLAFVFGILIDLLTLRIIGLSSIFFVVFTYLIFLYQSKFEITSGMFIFIASLTGSVLYLILNNNNSNIFLESIFSAVLGLSIFIIINKVKPRTKKT